MNGILPNKSVKFKNAASTVILILTNQDAPWFVYKLVKAKIKPSWKLKNNLYEMSSLLAKLSQCKHPNSRKTKALGKKVKRLNNKHKTRNNHATKSNILGEKLSWFLQKVEEYNEPLTPQEFQNLIELYFKRFDEELEQIHLKQSISKNRTNQHAARENVIKFTLEKEISEYNSGGIELMNLCDKHKMDELKNWDGSAINVQHLKLDLISKNFLNKLQENLQMKE